MNQNSYLTHQERMISLVSKIKKGDIIGKLKSGKAHYYKITNILPECNNPITPTQTKTFELKFIGIGSSAIINDKHSIYAYGDILPYAQMRLDESKAKFISADDLRKQGWTDFLIDHLPEPYTYLDNDGSKPICVWRDIDIFPLQFLQKKTT